MATNIIPKVDGAGSVVPIVDAVPIPRPTATKEYDEYIIVGKPASDRPSETEVLNSGLAIYTFEQSPNIPQHISETCVGWCSDNIYAKWPSNKDAWEKLDDCSALGNGKRIVELKMYCPNGRPSPVVDTTDEYTAVYFRNVAMTRVLVEDNNDMNLYNSNIIEQPQACIEENNGKRWGVIRYAGQGREDGPKLHMLVREIQGVLNDVVYRPKEAEVTVEDFIGSERGPGLFDDWSAAADELAECQVFIAGEAAATILDYIVSPDNSGLSYRGTRFAKYVCGSGTGTEIINSYTNDSAEDYFPTINGMMVNPWPNLKCTCESGLFVSFSCVDENTLEPRTASLALSSKTTYKTFYALDVTADDLSLEARSAYEPCESGGLWCRYFGGSSDIWDKVAGKNSMMGFQQDAVRDLVFSSCCVDKWRVGVYVDNKGEIIAVKTGMVLGEEVTLNTGLWNDIIDSRTHQSFIMCGAPDEGQNEYISVSGVGNYTLIAGYECSEFSTEFIGCVNYTRKMQFGEIGITCSNGYCGTEPITLAKRVKITTGDKGVAQSESYKINRVVLYSGDDEASVPNPPSFLTLPDGSSGTNIVGTIDLDAMFTKTDDGVYEPGQSCTFSVSVTVQQRPEDLENGVYYPDPSKRSTDTRWIPFAAMSGLGYRY